MDLYVLVHQFIINSISCRLQESSDSEPTFATGRSSSMSRFDGGTRSVMEGEVETEDSAVEAVEPLETEDPERVLLSKRVKRGGGNPSMIMLRSRERGPASTIWTKGQI
jgi:hypothetical protein